MKRWVAGMGLILLAMFLFSYAFFTLGHREKPGWLVDVFIFFITVFIGILIYFIIRRLRK